MRVAPSYNGLTAGVRCQKKGIYVVDSAYSEISNSLVHRTCEEAMGWHFISERDFTKMRRTTKCCYFTMTGFIHWAAAMNDGLTKLL